MTGGPTNICTILPARRPLTPQPLSRIRLTRSQREAGWEKGISLCGISRGCISVGVEEVNKSHSPHSHLVVPAYHYAPATLVRPRSPRLIGTFVIIRPPFQACVADERTSSRRDARSDTRRYLTPPVQCTERKLGLGKPAQDEAAMARPTRGRKQD